MVDESWDGRPRALGKVHLCQGIPGEGGVLAGVPGMPVGQPGPCCGPPLPHRPLHWGWVALARVGGGMSLRDTVHGRVWGWAGAQGGIGARNRHS